MIEWIEIFCALAVIDVLYAIYTKKVQQDKPFHASLFATAIYSVNALVVISFVQDPWLLVPAALGSFVGTYVGVKINIGVDKNRRHTSDV